jgi:endonuclease YncB( thermonuclease family)
LADLALALAILGAVALAAEFAMRLWPGEILAGAARATDGDSLVVGGARIRLEGIDAPELAQNCRRDGSDYACGREAREALADLIAGRDVSCESRQSDRYGRALAVCAAGGVELNRAMVEAGWAVAYGGYRDAEAAARRARRGLWAGTFDEPQEWRRSHGVVVEERPAGLLRLLRLLRRLLGA